MTPRLKFPVFLALLLAAAAAAAFAPPAPSERHAATAQAILDTLQSRHLAPPRLDDRFARKVFDLYLDTLDPGRIHLSKADLAPLRGRIRALDEDLEAGRLDLFYAVYARFQQRRAERLRAALAWLEAYPEGFEPNGDQSLETDPDKLERPRDEAGLRALWRKLVLNDVLNLKLADTPEPELVDTLRKRYRNQLKRLEETNADDVFEFAMAALTHAYDPHTDYFPPREAENFDIHMSLSLEGIGALLQREDDYVKVVRLIPGGPAERSRLLRPADRIVGVGQGEDGEIVNVEGWRLDDVVDLIRGPKGTVVRLNILPADSNDPARVRTIVITRDTVRLEEQAAHKELIEQRVGDTVYRIGLITLPSFYVDQEAAFLGDPNYRSSARDVARLIRELEDEGMDALIIDLRNNGGGSLEEVRVITGYFIPKGPVVQVRGSGEKPRVLNDTRPGTLWDGPLAVLVNRLSASASEIFAAAIQDWGRGVVLGERTFGKGTVQTLDRLGDGRIKYTQAMFYRVNGDSTQLRGVEPDIVFPSLFDHDDIGESALPEALPWDRIAPVIEAPPRAHRVLVEYLRGRQTERAATDPDFVYLRAQAELLGRLRADTEVPLNEAKRRAQQRAFERDQLVLANRWRQSRGLEPLPDFAALEAWRQAEDTPSPEEGLIDEAAAVLVDWLLLEPQRSTAQRR